MSDLAYARGIGYLDAPVLGRPDAVGKWALPVGGRLEDLEKCRDILGLMASYIVHAGPSGMGNKIKLLNQMMFGAINAITAEMMAVANRMGIDQARLFEIITASQAGTVSNLFRELGARIARNAYDNPVFSVDLLAKDIRLAVQMAKESDAPPLLCRNVEFLNELAQIHGLGSKDTSIMWEVYRKMWSE
jgi:3-hydroxyisobutyrate dehydrogenase/2-hydroxy-3-oxopropionate reductase